ncbi:hypothetical protein D3C76_1275930 [compost metagenome]
MTAFGCLALRFETHPPQPQRGLFAGQHQRTIGGLLQGAGKGCLHRGAHGHPQFNVQGTGFGLLRVVDVGARQTILAMQGRCQASIAGLLGEQNLINALLFPVAGFEQWA